MSLFHHRSEPEQPQQPSIAQQLGDFLGCEWVRVDANQSAEDITALYCRALAECAGTGCHPMLIAADDLLLETLEDNCDDNGGAAAYREALLQMPCENGHDILYDPERRPNFDDPYAGISGKAYPLEVLLGVTQRELRRGEELMLVRLPVSDPARVFAYLPFGNWNECPDAPELIAVCSEWQRRYGAVPAMLTHDVLQMYTPRPLTDHAEAMKLAAEHFSFCEDLSQGIGTVGALADSLVGSDFWYFWWD